MAKQEPLSIPFGSKRYIHLLRYFLAPGPGGPLLLLWSVGFGLFLIIGQLMFALAWTGVVILLGLWMMRNYLSNPKVWEQFLHSSLAERFSWKSLSDQSLRETVQSSANILVEVALKLYRLGRSPEAQVELSRALTAASALFSLQVELARKVEDLARGLTLVVPNFPVGTDLITEAPAVRRETVDTVRQQATLSRAMIGDIGQQLETLLLQAFHLETLPDTESGAAELAGKWKPPWPGPRPRSMRCTRIHPCWTAATFHPI